MKDNKSNMVLGFGADTRIPLLNGRQATLQKLNEQVEPFWIYALDIEKELIVPGLARSLAVADATEFLKVVISGGDEIICKNQQKLIALNKNVILAEELKFNSSLMPFYRKWTSKDGYESVSSGKGNSKLTHKMVWVHLHGKPPAGYAIHHKNHIHLDNRPENLESLTFGEHSRHHNSAERRGFPNKDPTFQTLRNIGIANRKNDPLKHQKMVEIGRKNVMKYMQEKPEHFHAAVKDNGKRGAEYLKKFNTSPKACPDCGVIVDNPATLRWHKNKEHGYNHRVLEVEKVNGKLKMYCLQVENFHTFALASGIFVCSM